MFGIVLSSCTVWIRCSSPFSPPFLFLSVLTSQHLLSSLMVTLLFWSISHITLFLLNWANDDYAFYGVEWYVRSVHCGTIQDSTSLAQISLFVVRTSDLFHWQLGNLQHVWLTVIPMRDKDLKTDYTFFVWFLWKTHLGKWSPKAAGRALTMGT